MCADSCPVASGEGGRVLVWGRSPLSLPPSSSAPSSGRCRRAFHATLGSADMVQPDALLTTAGLGRRELRPTSLSRHGAARLRLIQVQLPCGAFFSRVPAVEGQGRACSQEIDGHAQELAGGNVIAGCHGGPAGGRGLHRSHVVRPRAAQEPGAEAECRSW